MKKFIDPIPNGGAPMFSDTVVGPIFKDIYLALDAILNNISAEVQGVIVKGCVVTANGGNWDCTSGIVYLNGQFMDFAGFTNQPATRYIVAASAVNTSFPFFDGSTSNLIITQSATHQGSAPVGVQYISVSNTTPRSLKSVTFTPVEQGGTGTLGNKVYIGWGPNSGGGGSGSNRLRAIVDSTSLGDIVFDNVLFDAINVNYTAWRTDATWATNWQTYATIPLKFKVNNGMLIMMGGSEKFSGGALTDNELMFTLPSGCRPSTLRVIGVQANGVTGTDQVAVFYVVITTSGTVTIRLYKNAGVSAISTPIFMDNICIPIS